MNPAEEYILNQAEPYRSILLHLQVIIENTLPEAKLKYKYSIPFYYLGTSPCCYLNVPKRKNYVDVGFWNAAHLTVNLECMTTTGRKMMKSLRYETLEAIDDTILIEVLHDAYAVRDQKFYK